MALQRHPCLKLEDPSGPHLKQGLILPWLGPISVPLDRKGISVFLPCAVQGSAGYKSRILNVLSLPFFVYLKADGLNLNPATLSQKKQSL